MAKSERHPNSSYLKDFEEGLKALYGKKWAPAAKSFQIVIENVQRAEVVARARQLLAACETRLDRTPSEEESDRYLKAIFLRNQGDLDSALEICTRDGTAGEDGRFAYLAASIHAVQGRSEEARKALSNAIELNPASRVHAYHDPDFDELREAGELAEYFDVVA